MAPLSNHVSMVITTDSVGIKRAGFGVPLITSFSAAWVERVRSYGSTGEVLVDFATNTPEYLAAQALFGQSPAPETIKIGRCALQPTLRYTLSVATVRNSYTYSVRVKGTGFAETTVTYTSDASATDGEIVAGLVAALNAVVSKNYTAAGAASPFTVTGNAAGNWFALEVNPNDLLSAIDHADPGIATDLAAIQLENDEWYALHTTMNSDALVKAAAAWIETQSKIYVFDVPETEAILEASDGTQGTLDDLKTLGYTRTMGSYHNKNDQMFSAGWLGVVLPLEPGAVVFHDKSVAGVAAVTLTSTQRANIVARRANSMEEVAGHKVTFDGVAFDGEYLDVRRDLDWLKDDMTKEVFGVIIGLPKVPFDDSGISLIEAAVRASLTRAEDRDILVRGSSVVTVPKASSVSTSDKNLRILPNVKFSATIAGAIHKVNLIGVVGK